MDKLPIELRSAIYRLAVQFDYPFFAGLPASLEPPVLSTCREARDEALRHFYSSNIFRIEVGRVWERGDCQFRSKAKKWLIAIGVEKASWIERVFYNHAAYRHNGRVVTGERLGELLRDIAKNPSDPRVDC